MLKIDPHIHSACFDGIDSPPQFIAETTRAGLDCVGLSGHDAFTGQDGAEAAISSTDVALIRDAEISYAANGTSIHLLALLPDPSSEGLPTCIERTHESRTTRALKVVENLSTDYPITWEQVLAFTPEEGPIGCPRIASALVVTEAFDDRSAVFVRVLHPSSPYYVHYQASDPIKTVQLVLEAGGVPVLAHPKARACQRLLPESVIEDMEEAGPSDIERDHRDHAPGDREVVDRIARRPDLRIFSFSDYHGAGKPSHIGENLTAPAIIGETVERAHLEVLHP